MEFAAITGLIISVLQTLSADKRITEEQRQATRIALSAAFHATEGYYASLSAGDTKDKLQEHEIARLWDEVAIRMEPFDPSVANRLGLKSRYWREGAAWSDEKIAGAKIQLNSIRQHARFALIRK